jgi:hypothetical protein
MHSVAMTTHSWSEAAKHVDATGGCCRRSLPSTYSTDAPIELLAYFVTASRPRDSAWQDEALGLIRAGLSRSAFLRVWLFDGFARSVVAHPPHLVPGTIGPIA